MKIQKLQLTKEKIDINLQFYFFLKHIVKLKPTDKQITGLFEDFSLLKHNSIAIIIQAFHTIFFLKDSTKNNLKFEKIVDITEKFQTLADIELFIFSLHLYQIKDLLLKEAKISEYNNIERLLKLDPLSLEYDQVSILKPYTTRVNGALLALLFFDKLNQGETNFMAESSYEFIQKLSKMAIIFQQKGLESNQIFMLMFSETINQSIISDSGSNYESRILSVLHKNGITDIQKIHDKNDKSTEFDFFFELEGRTFGIGAKRTLRERYKQFIKTALTSKIDVMIEVTLGIDLNEEKAKIISSHNTYLFVSDEIYQTRIFLQKLDNIRSVKDLKPSILKTLK